MWLEKSIRFWINGSVIRKWLPVLFSAVFLCGCQAESETYIPETSRTEGQKERQREAEPPDVEKGYELPVSEEDRAEAEKECLEGMECVRDIYKKAEKGEALNAILPLASIRQMKKRIKKAGFSVRDSEAYSNMENYEKVERFLRAARTGEQGFCVIFSIHADGGLCREKYYFDGKDMYVLAAVAAWENEDTPMVTSLSHTRLRTWKYTKNGWFCYEECVPEYPEVSEMVDSGCMIRVQPMSAKKRAYSNKFLKDLGYQGNNLLCSNWDIRHMDKLDYNAAFEFFYQIKYGKQFPCEKYQKGIPKEEFENLIREYLPVSAENIRKYAVFNRKTQTYEWARLGCFNYTLTFFGTSVPEVTHVREKPDGTKILTVAAVCERNRCEEAVITHELTVRAAEDGSFRYMGNRIKGNGLSEIPEYEYRIPKSRGQTEPTS